MFTGIIEELGTVQGVRRQGEDLTLTVAASTVLSDLKIGDSIAVSGACLTVTNFSSGGFTVDVSGETLAKTTLKNLRIGDRVNLERPLRPSDRMGGHFVTGHVDEVGTIQDFAPRGRMQQMTVKVTRALHGYLVKKGSIAVDGISLTVNEVTSDGFRVVVIPHTVAVTTLGSKRAGDSVNLEADLIGKYVERFVARGKSGDGIDREFLASHGFLTPEP
ncbi:MAG: riboflavin synthase [Nitrospirae bacterium]|nr:riboflavin synthase [Nitrospirota bacterium]